MGIKSDADRVLREVWLRAATDPDGLRIDCKSVNTAKHYRMRLYRIASAYREHPGDDPELHAAIQAISIAQPKDQWLVLEHSASAGMIGEIARQLGYNPAEEDAKRVQELERAISSGGRNSGQPDRTTPYFTREN